MGSGVSSADRGGMKLRRVCSRLRTESTVWQGRAQKSSAAKVQAQENAGEDRGASYSQHQIKLNDGVSSTGWDLRF